MSCYQAIKTMTKFEEQRSHRLNVFMKNNTQLSEMRDSSTRTWRVLSSYTGLTYQLSYYTVQLQACRLQCPISDQIGLVITNHLREFWLSFYQVWNNTRDLKSVVWFGTKISQDRVEFLHNHIHFKNITLNFSNTGFWTVSIVFFYPIPNVLSVESLVMSVFFTNFSKWCAKTQQNETGEVNRCVGVNIRLNCSQNPHFFQNRWNLHLPQEGTLDQASLGHPPAAPFHEAPLSLSQSR